MSPIHRWLFPPCILLLAWLAILQTGTAQIPLDYDKSAKGKIEDLLSTEKKDFPNDALNGGAKYYLYRVLEGKTETATNEALKQFQEHIKRVVLSRNNPALTKAYAPVLVARFKDLTDLPVVENGRAIVHVVQMMPTLAQLQDESISKYFLDILDPKGDKHDLIKLGAIKGLREMMVVDAWGDPTDQSLFKDEIKMARKRADLARVHALTQFILRPPPENAKPAELDAYRYLRREAIETLASAKAPAVAAIKRQKKEENKVEGPIADVLLRVLIPGAMTPETTLEERNEAALGLCDMKPLDKYAPGPTYYFINQTLFEMARDFSQDFPNIAADKRTLPTKFAWKYTSDRWNKALTKLVANAEKSSAADKKTADAIKARADRVLPSMFSFKANINANDALVPNLPPPKAEFSLFKSTIESTSHKVDAAK